MIEELSFISMRSHFMAAIKGTFDSEKASEISDHLDADGVNVEVQSPWEGKRKLEAKGIVRPMTMRLIIEILAR